MTAGDQDRPARAPAGAATQLPSIFWPCSGGSTAHRTLGCHPWHGRRARMIVGGLRGLAW
jgi:hypothetical protein